MRVPLLASLGAVTLLTPFAQGAVQVVDNDLTINIGMDVQERATVADASAANGASYDVNRAANGKSNDVDFNMRRARLLNTGTYGANWKFELSFNADNVDKNGDNSPTQSNQGYAANPPAAGFNSTNQATNSNSNREVTAFKAYLERIFELDESTKIVLHGGLDYPFFNRAIVGDPWWLFPQQRATGNLMGNRAVGFRGMVVGDMFDWGFDIDESMDPNKDLSNANRREGLFYSTRLQYTVWSDSGKKAIYHEDYQGKPGQSLMLTADIGYDNNDYGVANTRLDAYSYGFEGLFHWDALSALVEARFMQTKERNWSGAASLLATGGAPAGVNADIGSHVLVAQAGYCIPAAGIQIEPCLRYQLMNFNNVVTEQGAYNNGGATGLPAWVGTYGGATDRLNSGHQIDVGINWLFTPYTLMQTAYTHWEGEASAAGAAHRPDANIVRAQLQVAF
jgi:hypothetical protein